MKMNRKFLQLLRFMIAALLCAAFAVQVSAQSGGGYTISSSVIAGGGGDNLTGGGYRLDGTTGQTAAGGPLENLPFYSLLAGFRATLDSAPQTYSISGQVTYDSGVLSGVAMRLERDNVLLNTAQTDAQGNYSFANLEGGHNYSVIPSKDSYVIVPFNALFPNLGSNQTANFSVVSRNYKIKGQVTLPSGAGLNDVTISLRFQNANTVTTVLTDASGAYAFDGVGEGGPYTVEAQKAGYSFTPQNYVYNNLSSDQTANFSASVVTHSIGGVITTSTGTPLGGVTVSLTGSATSSTTTGSSGQYSFPNLTPGGNYTVTPSMSAYTFSPPSASINNLGKNEAANFTGTSTTPSLPGIEFEQVGYQVAENEHYKLIKVTRTGDTSGGSTVDYATQDVSATQQTDYTLMLGTLTFAPGETSKTLFFLVTEDSLVEGTETLSLTLSNPSGAILGNQSLAQIAITDNDSSASAPNAIDEATNFVRQHYHDFLDREPEPAGFEGWQEIINKCAANDTKCDPVEVSSAFYRSQEFHDRGYFIYRFYAASLNHVPKYLEFMRDMQKVSGYLSAKEQEEAKWKFIQEFMTRSEFKQRYEQITDASAYVDAILSAAGVSLPQREKLISELQAGKITRGEVLRAVIESAEVDAKFYAQAFVVMQYFGYLRRDPDIHYLEWIKTLEQTGDYRVMVAGFLNSKEYRQRFGQ
jgi:hypothetical protein